MLNTSSIVVGPGDTLKVDDSGSANISTNPAASNTSPGRVANFAPITLNNAKLWFVGASTGNSVQDVGAVSLTGSTSNNIESDQNGSGTSLLQMASLAYGASASVNFIGGGSALSADGANEITFLRNDTAAYPALTNGILPTATVTGPGSLDFATAAGGPNGVAIFALPAADYFTSLAAVPVTNITANVKARGRATPKRSFPGRSTPCCSGRASC